MNLAVFTKRGLKRQRKYTDVDENGLTKNGKRIGRPAKDVTGLTVQELRVQAREDSLAAGVGNSRHQTWTTDEDERLCALVERFGSKKWSFLRNLWWIAKGNSVAIGILITSRRASKEVNGPWRKSTWWSKVIAC